MKNKKIAALVLFTALLAVGCGKKDKAAETTLYIEKNGEVTEAIVESWDESFFDEKDLKSDINDEIKDFKSINKDASISMENLEIEDKKARVSMKYDSIASYSGFNKVDAFQGTISEAQSQGYTFDGEYISTDKKPSITVDELDGSNKYCVVILSENQKISTDFKILYASDNVKVSGNKKTADIDIKKEDADSLAYIIYKK